MGGPYYDEFITLDNYSMPSSILVGQSLKVYVNITVNSTTYLGSVTWRCDVTVTVTSVNGFITVQNSPQQDLTKFPGFKKQYVFTIIGAVEGMDKLKLDAKIRTGHGGGIANDTRFGDITSIMPPTPPVLSGGKVTPATGYNQTDFTYRVTYSDGNGDLPVAMTVSIDGGASKAMTLVDGNPNTIRTGEDYSLTINGTALGLGNHTFRFAANDGTFDATGDNGTKQGPRVDVYVAPNKPPMINILHPKAGAGVVRTLNMTGVAMDPDVGDIIDLVEVDLDGGKWSTANGTSAWYYVWDLTVITPGMHTFKARASDGKNWSTPASVTVDVKPIVVEPPVINITSHGYIAENILEVAGTSAPGNNSGPVDIVQLWADPIWTWTPAERKGPALGNGTPSYSSWAWTWNTSGLEPATYNVTAKATAGQLVSNLVSIQVEVLRFNHPPKVTTTDPVGQITMYEGGSRSMSIVATDPDGNDLTYLWYFDDQVRAPIGDPTRLTYKANYSSAGTHAVKVVIKDGYADNGTTTFTWNITVLEGFIVSDRTDLGDKILDSGEPQTFEVSVLDPEGQPLMFVWTVDGQKDASCIGPKYSYIHESKSEAASRHTVALTVSNSQKVTKDLEWTVDIRGATVGGGGGGGGGGNGQDKNNTSSQGQIMIYLLAAIVVAACIYLVYVGARPKRPKENNALEEPSTETLPDGAPATTPAQQWQPAEGTSAPPADIQSPSEAQAPYQQPDQQSLRENEGGGTV